LVSVLKLAILLVFYLYFIGSQGLYCPEEGKPSETAQASSDPNILLSVLYKLLIIFLHF